MKIVFKLLRGRPILIALTTSVLAGLILAVLVPNQAQATNPNLINFQGKVTNSDGTNVTNGTYNFDFVLYDDSSLGTPSDGVHDKWHELTKSVSVTNGVFQTELGSATALPNFNTNPALYLAIRFNADAAGYMSPRIHLDSVPYALNSDALGGLAAGSFLQLAQGVQADGSSSNASIAVNKTAGTADILALQKSGVDVVKVNNSGTLLLGQAGTGGLNGSLVFNTTNASSYAITISASATTGSSYSLVLPTTAPGTSQCLQSDASVASQLIFSSCGGGATSLQTAYAGGSAGDQVITLSSTNDSLVIRNPSSSGSNSGTSPLYIDQLATGAQGGLTINLAADSTLGSNTRTGLSLVTGALTETAASTGTFNGILLGSPGAISTTTAAGTLNWNGAALTVANATTNFAGSSINANGLKITTGTLTQTAGTLTENGVAVDLSSSTITTGGTLSGVNVTPMSTEPSVGTLNGVNVGSIASGGNGATSAGIKIGTGWDNSILGSGALSFATSSNGDLTVAPNGSGNLVVSGDSDTGLTVTGGGYIKVFDSTNTNYASITATLTDATFKSNTGATNLGSGTGAITIDSGTGAAITITAHAASTWSTDSSSALTITSAAAATWSTSAGDLTLQGGSGTVSLGTSTTLTANAGLTVTTASNGNLAFTPNGTGDLVLSIDADSNVQFTASASPGIDMLAVTNSGQASTTSGIDGLAITFGSSNASGDALHIIASYAGGATDTLTYNALEIDGFSPTNGAGTDTVNGILIGNLTDPGATITSSGLHIGTGWDSDIDLQDTASIIRLSATDNTGSLSINDSAGNSLLKVEDVGWPTGYGGLTTSGGFVPLTSYFGEEFAHDHAQVAAAGVATWPVTGTGFFSTGENGVCTWDVINNEAGGIGSMSATTTADTCTAYSSTESSGTLNGMLDVDNIPIMQMKVRLKVAGAGVPDTDHQFYFGMSDKAAASPAAGPPANGLFFSNCSSADQITTCSQGIYAVAKNGASTSVSASCGTSAETNFAYLLIKIKSSSSVEFWADVDTSDGIAPTLCATVTDSPTDYIINTAIGPFLQDDFVTNSNASTLDADYVRIWQDDSSITNDSSSDALNNETTDSSSASIADMTTPALSLDSPDPDNPNSFFNFNAAMSEDAVFSNNVVVRGTLYADKIKANSIEGLEVLTDKISSLSNKLAQSSQQTTSTSNSGGLSSTASQSKIEMEDVNFKSATISLDLTVMGSLFANGSLLVTGSSDFKGDVTFGSHISTDGDQPELVIGPAAGLTTDTAIQASSTIDGNDISGQLTINPGDNAGIGTVVSIKFNKAYSKTPKVILAPANDVSANTRFYVQTTKDGFKVISTDPLSPGATILINYWVSQ